MQIALTQSRIDLLLSLSRPCERASDEIIPRKKKEKNNRGLPLKYSPLYLLVASADTRIYPQFLSDHIPNFSIFLYTSDRVLYGKNDVLDAPRRAVLYDALLQDENPRRHRERSNFSDEIARPGRGSGGSEYRIGLIRRALRLSTFFGAPSGPMNGIRVYERV